MKVSALLIRAVSGLSQNTVYDSPGKMPSFDAVAWPEKARCDCSGFLAWCLRFSPTRRVDLPLYKRVNGGWFETTSIHADGLSSVGFFTKLDDPKPGAMLVYPDYIGRDGKKHDGHIGIVREVSGRGVAGVTKIIHCSLGQWRLKKDAIQETGSDIWLKSKTTIIVWFDGLEE